MSPAPLLLSELANRTPEQPISHFMKLALETPGLISLAAGFVDEETFPAAEVSAAITDILSRPETARAALQYGSTQGHLPLRTKLLNLLAAADGTTPEAMNLTADDVVITTGAQQLLYTMSEVLLDPGDLVVTEAPSYFVYHATLSSRGVQVLPVPMDEEGLDTDALEALLLKLEQSGEIRRLKMVYTVDYFQNPSGLTLSRRRREHLLELVRRFSKHHRILILEDAAYRELNFGGDDLPSIKSLDTDNQYVVYTSTFSKPCAAGLKTGYGILPPDVREPLLHFKGNHDFGSANFNQHVIDRLIETGVYERHVAKIRTAYRAKGVATTDALSAEFREWPGVTWTKPAGGMFVWVTFPKHVSTGPDSPLMKAAVREGVIYIPGVFCHVAADGGAPPDNELRLCYGVVTAEEIRDGVRRLARAAKGVLDSSDSREKPRAATVR